MKKIDIKEIEYLWMLRQNALIEYMIAFCKTLQTADSTTNHNTESPVIHTLDNVILELTKHKFF